MIQSIHLGYEVGSGAAVSIPVFHMAVTGQTQKSGKTTTLEALISRSKLPAVAFITKRGEHAKESTGVRGAEFPALQSEGLAVQTQARA